MEVIRGATVYPGDGPPRIWLCPGFIDVHWADGSPTGARAGGVYR
jgi:hypothetical protein